MCWIYTKKEAENYQLRFLGKIEYNEAVKKISFSLLFEDYLSNKKQRVKSTTIKKIKETTSTHIMPYFKNKDIYEITSRDILKWQNKILKNNNYTDGYLESI